MKPQIKATVQWDVIAGINIRYSKGIEFNHHQGSGIRHESHTDEGKN